MVLFPSAKINLGLHIKRKRPDGYHDIETCMVPFSMYDLLEITPSEKFAFIQTGITLPNEGETNLCEKAYHRLAEDFSLPPVRIHLRKQIPIGAGLGGGSADASFTLLGLNEIFQLNIPIDTLSSISSELGSDCPFFIRNTVQLATGKGEVLSPLPLNLNSYYLIVLNPGIHISTQMAYSGVACNENSPSIASTLNLPTEFWQMNLNNDFELTIFQHFPEIKQLKTHLYDSGAIYASMSGSGSSVFGLFLDRDKALSFQHKYLIYKGKFINQP